MSEGNSKPVEVKIALATTRGTDFFMIDPDRTPMDIANGKGDRPKPLSGSSSSDKMLMPGGCTAIHGSDASLCGKLLYKGKLLDLKKSFKEQGFIEGDTIHVIFPQVAR
mmetsp:Transcript_834/g.1188  ORF Transcript_834/g.1188 Transcript_834/m.1188 type:complete len:109 (+) Transcript_834:70-396(+)